MSWYYGTYSCGHDGRVDIIGPTKDRQRKADWKFEGLCPECYEKKKAEEMEERNKESRKRSEEMELPELTGSDKQVKWATTLRIQAIDLLYENIKDSEEKGITKIKFGKTGEDYVTLKEISNSIDYGINTYTEARYWIDNRSKHRSMLYNWIKQLREQEEIPKEVREEIDKEKNNLTVLPAIPKKDGVVIINLDDDGNILIKYVRDDLFREIVKKKSLTWNGDCWCLQITQFTGTADDRAAELGNALLSEGFTVRFHNKNSMDMALSGNFEPEQTRWISITKPDGKLSIWWDGYNDTLYNAAKKIPGAFWNQGKMKVSVEFYREVQDFAETMGFKFSKGALKAIAEYEEKEKNYRTENVNKVIRNDIPDEELLRKNLKSSGTIIEDLKDEA